MVSRKVLTAFVLSVAVASGGAVLAGDPAPEGTDPMMEAWMKLGAPGEHHEHLARMAGRWQAKVTMWMAPGAPPMTSEGTMTGEMIMGGRYLKNQYSGAFMGSEFSGFGIDGYDNQTGKHVGMWIDSMSTMLATFEGDCKDDGKVRTMWSVMTDPTSGQKFKVKSVTTQQGPDRFTYESWEVREGAEPHKQMEIVFTRAS